MTQVADLVATLRADVSNFVQGMGQAETALGNLGAGTNGSLAAVGQGLTSIATIATGAFAGGLATAVKQGLDFNQMLQQSAISFQGLGESAATAAQKTSSGVNFAQQFGLDPQQVEKSQQLLIGLVGGYADTQKNLTALAGAAATSGQPISQVTDQIAALANVMSNNPVMGQWQGLQLAKQNIESYASVSKAHAEALGGANEQVIASTLFSGLNGGGNAAQEYAQTMKGTITSLKTEVKSLAAEAFKPLYDDIVRVGQALSHLLQGAGGQGFAGGIAGEMSKLQPMVDHMVQAINGISTGKLLSDLKQMEPILAVVGGLGAAGGARALGGIPGLGGILGPLGGALSGPAGIMGALLGSTSQGRQDLSALATDFTDLAKAVTPIAVEVAKLAAQLLAFQPVIDTIVAVGLAFKGFHILQDIATWANNAAGALSNMARSGAGGGMLGGGTGGTAAATAAEQYAQAMTRVTEVQGTNADALIRQTQAQVAMDSALAQSSNATKDLVAYEQVLNSLSAEEAQLQADLADVTAAETANLERQAAAADALATALMDLQIAQDAQKPWTAGSMSAPNRLAAGANEEVKKATIDGTLADQQAAAIATERTQVENELATIQRTRAEVEAQLAEVTQTLTQADRDAAVAAGELATANEEVMVSERELTSATETASAAQTAMSSGIAMLNPIIMGVTAAVTAYVAAQMLWNSNMQKGSSEAQKMLSSAQSLGQGIDDLAKKYDQLNQKSQHPSTFSLANIAEGLGIAIGGEFGFDLTKKATDKNGAEAAGYRKQLEAAASGAGNNYLSQFNKDVPASNSALGEMGTRSAEAQARVQQLQAEVQKLGAVAKDSTANMFNFKAAENELSTMEKAVKGFAADFTNGQAMISAASDLTGQSLSALATDAKQFGIDLTQGLNTTAGQQQLAALVQQANQANQQLAESIGQMQQQLNVFDQQVQGMNGASTFTVGQNLIGQIQSDIQNLKSQGLSTTPLENDLRNLQPYAGQTVQTTQSIGLEIQHNDIINRQIDLQHSLAQAQFQVSQSAHALTDAQNAVTKSAWDQQAAQYQLGQALFQQTQAQLHLTEAQDNQAGAQRAVADSLNGFTDKYTQLQSLVDQLATSQQAWGESVVTAAQNAQQVENQYTTLNNTYTLMNDQLTQLTDTTKQYQDILAHPLQGQSQFAQAIQANKMAQDAMQSQINQLELQGANTQSAQIVNLENQLAVLQKQGQQLQLNQDMTIGNEQFQIGQAQQLPAASFSSEMGAAQSIGQLNDAINQQQTAVDQLKPALDAVNTTLTAINQTLQPQITALQGAAQANQALIQAQNGIVTSGQAVLSAQQGIISGQWQAVDAQNSLVAAQNSYQNSLFNVDNVQRQITANTLADYQSQSAAVEKYVSDAKSQLQSLQATASSVTQSTSSVTFNGQNFTNDFLAKNVGNMSLSQISDQINQLSLEMIDAAGNGGFNLSWVKSGTNYSFPSVAAKLASEGFDVSTWEGVYNQLGAEAEYLASGGNATTGFSSGGLISSPTNATMGEGSWPELVLPLANMPQSQALLSSYAPNLISSATQGSSSSGGMGLNVEAINVTVSGGGDMNLAQEVTSAVQDALVQVIDAYQGVH